MTVGGSSRGTSKPKALEAMRTGGLVPLYASADPGDLYRAALAILESGLSVIEVTLRGTIGYQGSIRTGGVQSASSDTAPV